MNYNREYSELLNRSIASKGYPIPPCNKHNKEVPNKTFVSKIQANRQFRQVVLRRKG